MADSADKTTVDFRRLRDANFPEPPSTNGAYVPVLTKGTGTATVTWADPANSVVDASEESDGDYVILVSVVDGVASFALADAADYENP